MGVFVGVDASEGVGDVAVQLHILYMLGYTPDITDQTLTVWVGDGAVGCPCWSGVFFVSVEVALMSSVFVYLDIAWVCVGVWM